MSRADFLDRHARDNSPVHRLPAMLKLLTATALVLATVLVPVRWYGYFGVLFALWLMVAMLSRVPFMFLLRRWLWLQPLVLGVSLLSLFQPGGASVFLGIVMRSTLCLLIMLLLANTTPFEEILALLRRLGLPAVLVTTLALLYRYLFVLVDETERMHRGRSSRTFSGRRRSVWLTGARLIGQLFVRSTERAERIYAAMCARGWR